MTINQSSANSTSINALWLFETLADSVWNWLGNARRLRLGFSEDTVSDLTALEIARLLPHLADVRRVTKHQERIVGFDWMWVFRKAGSVQAAYVVQAKKMKLDQSKGYSYASLRYKSGSRFQIEALGDFASWVGAKPMYCFYNNVDQSTARTHWHCQTERSPNEPQMGCTLAPLHVVQRIHDDPVVRKNFRSVHEDRYALPWRCLFHPQCAGDFGIDRVTSVSPFAHLSDLDQFASILKPNSHDDTTIDFETMIKGFNLADLIDRYTHGNFVPVPERIAVFDIRDGRVMSRSYAERST